MIAEDWIANTTGACPVAEGTPIDVVFRNGKELYGVKALIGLSGPLEPTSAYWLLENSSHDITHWRLHKSEKTLEDAYDTPKEFLFEWPKGVSVNIDNHQIVPNKPSKQEGSNVLIAFNRMTGHSLTEDELNTLKILLDVFGEN